MAFALSGPTAITTKQGESAFTTYQVTRTSKPYRNVSFSVLGLPAGFTAVFNPVSGTPTFNSTLKITAALNSPVGNFSIQVRAKDAKSTKTIGVVLSNYLNRPVDPTPPPTFTADWYISTTGSDSNGGRSVGDAFATITKANTVVSPGEIVQVQDGTYTYSSTEWGDLDVSGTPGNYITYRSETPGGVIIDGQHVRKFGLRISSANWIILDGFEIKNQYEDVAQGAASGIQIADSGAQNCIIRRCNIHHVGDHASTSDFAFCGIYIDRSGSGGQHDHGIYHKKGDSVIYRNNLFWHNYQGWAVQLFDQSIDNLKILNNTFYDGVANPGAIIQSCPLTNSDIANNIFANQLVCGLAMNDRSCSNNTIRNNLSTNGISDSTPPGFVFTDNTPNGSPNFVNAGALNFHLVSPSDAIDTGLTLADVPDDYDGTARSGTYEIGAFQY